MLKKYKNKIKNRNNFGKILILNYIILILLTYTGTSCRFFRSLAFRSTSIEGKMNVLKSKLTKDLALDKSQETVLGNIINETLILYKTNEEKYIINMKSLISEISSDEINIIKINEVFKQHQKIRASIEDTLIKKFIVFNKILNHDQKIKLGVFISKIIDKQTFQSKE